MPGAGLEPASGPADSTDRARILPDRTVGGGRQNVDDLGYAERRYTLGVHLTQDERAEAREVE